MKKFAVLSGLGDFYSGTGFSKLTFTLQNVKDFNDKLGFMSWDRKPFLYDKEAKKSTIIDKLKEVFEKCKKDDWVLFYYTGHASGFWIENPQGGGRPITYCVTYNESLTDTTFPGIDKFLTEIDYDDLIKLFHEKVPDGHLITILDCCSAFGLVENFGDQTEYHTIIAASSEGHSAYYNTNSFFFQAFRQCWDSPFEELEGRLKSIMKNIKSPNTAVVQIASNFINQSLNIQK